MSKNYKLPTQQQTKDETKNLKKYWKSGPFHFLMNRTEEKYYLKANLKRLSSLDKDFLSLFPVFDDSHLKELYFYACNKYQKKCTEKHENTGFAPTYYEEQFLASLLKLIKQLSKLKHIEIYPSLTHSPDFHPGLKMVIGNYVPDFIIFGLTTKGFTAITVEINGDAHLNKFSKDLLRSVQLEEIDIAQMEIPNNKAKDLAFIKDFMNSTYRPRNGSFNDQIRRLKRKIWVKTIVTQLTIDEIETFIAAKFNYQLNLYKEIHLLKKTLLCPRIIKKELVKLNIP